MDRNLLKPDPGSWDAGSSHDWCLRLARSHYENFPVASFFLPAAVRPHIAAIYAFARIADDIADEPGMSREERFRLLDEWERQLDTIGRTAADHPVFDALAQTIGSHSIPSSLLKDLLSAFRQDVDTVRYDSFAQLLDYCRRSANPVGRIVLMLAGHHDDEMFRESDSICTALQLTNFWQDFSQDASRGRVYVPAEDFRRFGLDASSRPDEHPEAEFRELMAYQVDRTKNLFYDGKPLIGRNLSGLSMQLRMTWHGGMRVLEKIERSGYNVVSVRPRLIGIDAGFLLVRALLRR